MALLGGVWLSLLYCAFVVPATVWVIQLTVSRGWWCALLTGGAMAAGQVPWSLAAGAALADGEHFWRVVDPWLRLPLAGFLMWLALRMAKTGPVRALRVEVPTGTLRLMRAALHRSLLMPWRPLIWFALIFSVGVHLRGPGWDVLPGFIIGTLGGQLLWHAHFILIAALFGKRVPEAISLKSINKFRLLATVVAAGLALLILLPLTLTFSY